MKMPPKMEAKLDEVSGYTCDFSCDMVKFAMISKF